MATLEQQHSGSLSVARARRRPARYSPAELSASVQQHQSEMVIGALLVNTPEEAASLLLQQELDQQEEEELANVEEMAPTKRTKPKSKKRPKKKQNDDGGKRPRVANVLLENEELIDEIRVRKALWMRTHEQHHSSNLTAPLWEDIAKILGTTQENIKKRWKSLKDHYRRELKKSMTDATAPPSTWPYYKKMRFMKSQMFLSLRRKDGEDHLQILSSDEEDVNNQWNGHMIRGKQETGSETMDDYEMTEGYDDHMIKYEQQMLHNGSQEEMEGGQEEDEEELEEEEEDPQQAQQNAQEQEEEEEEQGEEEMSPMDSLQEQEELSTLQQVQNELSELTNISPLQQQADMSPDMTGMTTIAEIGGIPAIVTSTTASSLNGQLSAIQHHASEMQRSDRLSATLNGEITARQSALQQQRAEINGRLSAIQRTAEINAMQERANISALHERAEMTALQQRAEMRQRNSVVGNGVGSPNVSSMISDDRGGISDDYHFFMSLMPHVRNFTSLQKLKGHGWITAPEVQIFYDVLAENPMNLIQTILTKNLRTPGRVIVDL